MPTEPIRELASFHRFIAEQLNSGQVSLSPEDALDIWRMQRPSPEQYREDVEAIREALADMEAGDTGRPVEEFLAEFRMRHNLD